VGTSKIGSQRQAPPKTRRCLYGGRRTFSGGQTVRKSIRVVPFLTLVGIMSESSSLAIGRGATVPSKDGAENALQVYHN
jgi:hypothetical protein